MTRRARGWMVLLAVAGLAAAATSSYMHLQLVSNPAYTSFCDISDAVSCTQLYQSRYGSVAGVPVALGGVFWFGVVLLLALADARGPIDSRPNIAAYLLVWSTVGLSVAMYLAYASVFVLQTFCVLCGVVYLAVLGIFTITGSESATPLRRLPSALVHDTVRLVGRPVGLGVTLVFIAGTVAAAAWFPDAQSFPALADTSLTDSSATTADPVAAAEQQSEFERFWGEQPRLDVALNGVNAPVVVIKYNDYQCPACAETHRTYGPIFAKYESSHPGSVRLVLRDFPLDPECNDQSPSGPHDVACEAAVAARLARAVGENEAQRMDEWLYTNQASMTPEMVVTALEDIAGVSGDTFAARYDDVLEDVKADILEGAALPVEATPTFVINGILLKGGLAPRFFDQAIAVELRLAASAP